MNVYTATDFTDLHLAQTSCNGSSCKVDACADLTGVFDVEDLVPRPCTKSYFKTKY